MFIGETGSWLFVGAFHIYKRYTTWSAGDRIEYQPVPHDEPSINDDASSMNSDSPTDQAGISSSFMIDGRAPLKGWRLILLGLPAICDICGTTLMNIGLLFVVPSIYQMTRGALVLFVGIFSVLFLKRNLYLFQWFALVTVVLGVGIVGLAGSSHKNQETDPHDMSIPMKAPNLNINKTEPSEAFHTIIGVLLIAGAQVFTASQFVLEEFILASYSLEPLKVVGLEGLFGLLVTFLGMVTMYLLIGQTSAGQYGYFDIEEGWREITQNKSIGVSSILIMISIGQVLIVNKSIAFN